MVIVFIDILGFSNLVKINEETAHDNLDIIYRIIKTALTDYKTLKDNSKNKDLYEVHSISTFKHLIKFSDSIIVATDEEDNSNKMELFFSQLSKFITKIFYSTSSGFIDIDTISDLKDIKGNYANYDKEKKKLVYHDQFPIMFRGGISFGRVGFFKEPCICNVEENWGFSVEGLPYVEAVKLESYGLKGPRLIFSEKNKKFFEKTNIPYQKIEKDEKNKKDTEDKYEIIWTFYACEVGNFSISHKLSNINSTIDKLLKPTINLYNYYENENSCNIHHYEKFIKLICKGLFIYAKKNKIPLDNIEEQLDLIFEKKKLKNKDFYRDTCWNSSLLKNICNVN